MYSVWFAFEDFFRPLQIQGDLIFLFLRVYSRLGKLASWMSVDVLRNVQQISFALKKRVSNEVRRAAP